MKKHLCYLAAISLALATGTHKGAFAQKAQSNTKADTLKVATPKAGGTTNVMLNASADNGPRAVNIGLPASVGGTTILENGLPVTYDYMGQMPTAVWRSDGGISKFEVLNVSQTALLASDVGVSVSTYTNRGTDVLKGSASFSTNSFGLLRGDLSVSGPINNGWQYSLTGFINRDPGTFSSNISHFLDKTEIFKGVLNKKYRRGQIGIQYKYAHSASISTKQSPYIYRENGSVDRMPNFRIGRDAYLEQSGKIHTIDPLTGKAVVWDALKDLDNTSHVIDIFGDHKFNNNSILDYTIRYHYADAGMYNPYYTSIEKNNSTVNDEGKYAFYYADFKNPYGSDKLTPYKGEYYQKAMMIAAPSSKKTTVMARVELNRKSEKHHWMVGFHNWFYDADKVSMATYNYMFEVAPNPKALLTAETDKFGNRNYNAAMQYYNGYENKMALVGTERWIPSNKFEFNAGARIEWQRIDGDWYSQENRDAAPDITWLSGQTTDVKKNWWNISATANATYKAFKNAGFLADVYYIQQAGKLSSFAGADDPKIEKCEIPGVSFGVYYNSPFVSVVSKVTKIKRTNFKNNSTFNATWTDEAHPGIEFSATTKQTSSYDVSTIGWTTDVLLKPFKGFNLHLLLTVQNPKYENYQMTVNYKATDDKSGATSTHKEEINNNGNVARSVSKTLIEIDPSYSFGKFRVWASARYFSKEYANYPNTLTFEGRWETFAGLDFKYDKNVSFAISAVNLLNQTGAQGSISGTNTTTAEMAKALYDKPLCGTYIRPFTVEFKTKIRF